MAGKIHTIHDRFMKSMLGDIIIGREYLYAFLTTGLNAIIELTSSEHTTNSYVSDELQETLADVLFK